MSASPPAWYVHGAGCPECGEVHFRCADHNQDGGPCGSHPVNGTYKCKRHGGMTLRRAGVVAPEDLDNLVSTYASIEPLLARAHVQTSGMDPAESVSDALNRANAMVMMLRTLVGTLAPRAEFTRDWVETGGNRPPVLDIEVTREGLIGPDHHGNLTNHPWMVLYREWVQIQGQLATKASDLGLAAQQVKVAEAQFEVMAQMLLALLADFGIDISLPENQAILERHLLALDSTIIDIEAPALTATATSS